MSFYRVMSWEGKSITKLLKSNDITNFVGNDTECHLDIPDNLLVHDLTILMLSFDVMFIERHGTKNIWLDKKNGMFTR